MVAAGCATAAGILGYQVLRRSKSARLALTVLAAPLFLTGMVTGGFVSSLVAASAVMLWLQPARDWFRTARCRRRDRRRPPGLKRPLPAAWPAAAFRPAGVSTGSASRSRPAALAAAAGRRVGLRADLDPLRSHRRSGWSPARSRSPSTPT